MVGVGLLDAHREGRRYIVHSDELLSALSRIGMLL
jgi:hypothetical protein